MKPLIFLLFILASICWSQAKTPYIAFSPQGAEVLKARTGKVIPGVQLLGVLVCHANLDGGDIYGQAAAAGYPFISFENAVPLVISTVNHSRLKTILELAGYASEGAALIVSAGIVTAGARTIFSTVAGHGIADKVVENLKGRLPDVVGLNATLIDPTKAIGGDGCISGNILAKYGKGIPTGAQRINLGMSLPINTIQPTTVPIVPEESKELVAFSYPRFDKTELEYLQPSEYYLARIIEARQVMYNYEK